MKKRPLSYLFAAPLLALGLLIPAPQILMGQDKSEVKKSGSIQMQIDPGPNGFDIPQIEQQIRQMIKGLNLGADQEKQLDEAIEAFKQSLKNDNDGKPKKFEWKWEFDSPNLQPLKDKIKEQAPKLRQKAEELAPGLEPFKDLIGPEAKEMFEKFFGQGGGPSDRMFEQMQQFFEGMGGGQNPDGFQKMFEQMMKQFGLEGPGERHFRFRLGPNGLEQIEGDEKPGQGQEFKLPWVQRLFGGGRELDPDNAPRESKYSRLSLAEYRSAVKDARASTVAVLQEGRQVALGTVVSADGHVITKASEVSGKGTIECECMNGRIHTAKLMHSLPEYDLALLKIENSEGLKPATFKEGELPVGTMIAAAGIDEDPISIGVVSVLPRNLDSSTKGFLGIAPEDNPDGPGLIVRRVVEGSPAEKAQIKVGDIILGVNGESIDAPLTLTQRISSLRPGEIVKLRIKDGNAEEDVEVTLISREENDRLQGFGRLDPTARMGSDLSDHIKVRTAVQNDLGINANQAGGPVTDIDGHIVGINIARAGRTSTYMLPAATVKPLLQDLANGKLSKVLSKSDLEADVLRMQAEMKKLEEEMKKKQESLKQAEDALKKVQ